LQRAALLAGGTVEGNCPRAPGGARRTGENGDNSSAAGQSVGDLCGIEGRE